MLINKVYKLNNHIKYNLIDIENFLLQKEDIMILTEIGLPYIDTGYHNFYPIEKLQKIEIETISYLILGYPFNYFASEKTKGDSIILLNPITREISLYAKKMFEIGYSRSLFWTVNKNLSLFLKFHQSVMEIVNMAFFSASEIDFNEIKAAYINMTNDFVTNDLLNFKKDDYSVESYWRGRCYELKCDIQEKYDCSMELY